MVDGCGEELAELGEQLVAGLVTMPLVQLVELVEADHEDPGLFAVGVAALVVAAELKLPRLSGSRTGQGVEGGVALLHSAHRGGHRRLGAGQCSEGVGEQRDQRFGVVGHRWRKSAAEADECAVRNTVGQLYGYFQSGHVGEEAIRRQIGRQHTVGNDRELRVDRRDHDPLVVVGPRQEPRWIPRMSS